ncbi:MerR family transcriptional regulator [Streptomyces sp. NPDC085946]|uniref:MerR family transcriptional regulator n=1 Tax=Streptomyces sp. NPDC085946 TaxID=3365744 RepID=UPI0037CDC894
MRISRLAERSGVPATTLRLWEGAGLLPADRTPAGYRLYGEDAVERLAFIGAARHLGLPLKEIGCTSARPLSPPLRDQARAWMAYSAPRVAARAPRRSRSAVSGRCGWSRAPR